MLTACHKIKLRMNCNPLQSLQSCALCSNRCFCFALFLSNFIFGGIWRYTIWVTEILSFRQKLLDFYDYKLVEYVQNFKLAILNKRVSY